MILRSKRAYPQQLPIALDNRVIIEQALSVLAERPGLTIPEVFTRLRARARNNRMRIGGDGAECDAVALGDPSTGPRGTPRR